MKARAVILSYKAAPELIKYIRDLEIEVIFSTKSKTDERIADHPDLQLNPIDDKTYMVAPELLGYYQDNLIGYGVKLIEGQTELASIYPKDCPYNVARVGNFFLSMEQAIDPNLREKLEGRGLKGIFQKQAYAKCMTIGFDNFAITCDKSIEKALKNLGIEVYYVSPEGIKLDGFDIGFLGGSCGIIDYKKVLFTGDLSQLKDFNILKRIFDEKGIEIVYPTCDLVDLGSIIPIY